LRHLLASALRRAGRDEDKIDEYEMDIYVGPHLLTTFVAVGAVGSV
jgi:hypothetical protein